MYIEYRNDLNSYDPIVSSMQEQSRPGLTHLTEVVINSWGASISFVFTDGCNCSISEPISGTELPQTAVSLFALKQGQRCLAY